MGWLVLVLVLAAGCDRQPMEPRSDAAAMVDGNGPAPAEADPWQGRDDLIQAPPPAMPAEVNLPTVVRRTLPNGLKLRLIADHTWPLVGYHLVLPARVLDEPRERRSIADFAAQMLPRGAGAMSADQIAESIDFVGGVLKTGANDDGTHLVCDVLSEHRDTCRRLLPELAQRPTFPEQEMGQVRDVLISKVRMSRDEPRVLVQQHFLNLLWGEDDPRGWPVTQQTVSAISRADLVAWQRTHQRPDGAILVVYGDLDVAEEERWVERAFGGWPQVPAPPERALPARTLSGMTIRLVDKPDLIQAEIRLGSPGLSRSDPDFLPVSLMNYTLGAGGFSSRLMEVVRARAGKTYHASSAFDGGRERGAFTVWTFTRTPEVLATLRLVLSEIERMAQSGPTEAELAAARAHLAGAYPLGFQTVSNTASELLLAELHGLDEDWVRRYPVLVSEVPLERVRAAARRYLSSRDLVVTILGQGDAIAAQLQTAGLAFERVGYLEPISASERAAKRASEQAPPDPARSQRGRQLLGLALEAKGGLERVRAVKSWQMNGKARVRSGGREFEGELRWSLALPERSRVEMELPFGTLVSVVTAEGAWSGLGEALQPLSPEQVVEEQRALWRDRESVLLRHLDPGTVVQALEPQLRDGQRFEAVELRRADGTARSLLLLDPQTHLLARMEYEKKDAPAHDTYQDYREVAGIRVAHHIQVTTGDSFLDLALREVQPNVELAPALFARPAARTQ